MTNDFNEFNEIYDIILNSFNNITNYESLMNIINFRRIDLKKNLNGFINEDDKNTFKNLMEIYNDRKNILFLSYKKENNSSNIRIFGEIFVNNNKYNCYLLINNNRYELCEYYNIDDMEENNELINVILIENKKMIDLSHMFSGCKTLLSISNSSRWNISQINNLSYLFYDCQIIEFLPDISNWDTRNVLDISYIFSGCKKLKNLPDISKWDVSKVTNMSNAFSGCKSLNSLIDFSKWNTYYVNNIDKIFFDCNPSLSLPSIYIGDNYRIKKIIGEEDIYFSDIISQKKIGLISRFRERKLIITNKSIYAFKDNKIKDKKKIENIIGIIISKYSDQFILQFSQSELNYFLISSKRTEIIEILENTFESLLHKELLFFIADEKDLSNLFNKVNNKNKSTENFIIEKKNLMSIREFIDSKGSVNINSHLNTQILEKEFNKNNKYKEGISFSDFKITSLIGKGKTANIYLAKYKNENVALKVIDKLFIYENDMIDKILLEKNILSSFSEQNFICQMKFFFMTKTKICFVLPFFQGGDLFTMLRNKGPFDESTTAFYSCQIAQVISFLHSKNILYRDLKPENIMVNNNGYLTLIDFGSCKIIEDKTELQSSFIGSIDYMSPEVINGEGHNKMTDWWSFGILIYEMLYGKPPFHAQNIERAFELITLSKVRFKSEKKFFDYYSFKDIILRLLKKEPNERLGQEGLQQILNHPFFESIAVKNVLSLKTFPPYKPIIGENIIFNFDLVYTSQPIENFSEIINSNIIKKIDYLFDSFKK